MNYLSLISSIKNSRVCFIGTKDPRLRLGSLSPDKTHSFVLYTLLRPSLPLLFSFLSIGVQSFSSHRARLARLIVSEKDEESFYFIKIDGYENTEAVSWTSE